MNRHLTYMLVRRRLFAVSVVSWLRYEEPNSCPQQAPVSAIFQRTRPFVSSFREEKRAKRANEIRET